jgi:DNA-binding NarL/FixJ family response regulator
MGLRILIADDHRLFGELLAALLADVAPNAHVENVPSFSRALAVVDARPPFDLILLDLNMPGMLGLTGLEQILAKCPGVPVAIVSGTMRQSDMRGALKAGARGVLPKTLSGAEVRAALSAILAGKVWSPRALAEAVELEGPSDRGVRGQLTPREREVYEALVGGRCNAEIAELLAISEVTVKIHLQSVYRKLGAKNRSDAVRMGMSEAALRHAVA